MLPCLAHQKRTIAIASDFRVDGAKWPEIPQKEWIRARKSQPKIAKSLATFHRTLTSQCKHCLICLVSEIASDFWGPRWASQSQIAKIAAISVRKDVMWQIGPPARNAKKMAENGFWPPRKKGKNGRKMRKWPFLTHFEFGPILPFFGHFSPFWRWG